MILKLAFLIILNVFNLQTCDFSAMLNVGSGLLLQTGDSNLEVNDRTRQIESDSSIQNNDEDDKVLGVDSAYAIILIPAVVAIGIFLIGWLLTWLNRKIIIKQKREATKSTIVNWVKFTKKTVDLQVLALKDFANKLEKTEKLEIVPLETVTLLVDKLQQFSLKELTETIIINLNAKKNEKEDIIFHIVAQTDFLTIIESQIKENYIIYKENNANIIIEWNGFDKKAIKIINDVYIIIEDTNLFSEALERREQIRMKYGEVGFKTLKSRLNEFIIPHYNILKQDVSSSSYTDSLRNKLLELKYIIDEMKFIIEKWERHKNFYKEENLRYALNINAAYKDLNTYVNKLEIRKLKKIFTIR